MVLVKFYGVTERGSAVPGRVLECADRKAAAHEIEKILKCPNLDAHGGIVRMVFDVALDLPSAKPAPDVVATARH